MFQMELIINPCACTSMDFTCCSSTAVAPTSFVHCVAMALSMYTVLPPEVLAAPTPSAAEGVSEFEERRQRIFGCELVQEAGILLQIPQVVMITGQYLANRFYYRKSLKRFDAFTVAMGCLFLSTKLEEHFKHVREILFVFHHMFQRRRKMKPLALELGGTRYNEWKDELFFIEGVIMKELGFSFYNIIDHPHKYILYFVKILNGNDELAQRSWNYVNDSMRLDLSLRYPAQVLACSTIFMAARFMKLPLPKDWWKLMTDSEDDIFEICNEILGLYEQPKFEWLEPLNGEFSKHLSPTNDTQ